MSEFIPTTTATFYTTHTPFDDYDIDEDFTESAALTGIPIQILTSRVSQFQPVDNRGTTVKTYSARVRGHHAIQLDYVIEDEVTLDRYSIIDMDKPHNPMGDSSWRLTLKKVSPTAGQ